MSGHRWTVLPVLSAQLASVVFESSRTELGLLSRTRHPFKPCAWPVLKRKNLELCQERREQGVTCASLGFPCPAPFGQGVAGIASKPIPTRAARFALGPTAQAVGASGERGRVAAPALGRSVKTVRRLGLRPSLSALLWWATT